MGGSAQYDRQRCIALHMVTVRYTTVSCPCNEIVIPGQKWATAKSPQIARPGFLVAECYASRAACQVPLVENFRWPIATRLPRYAAHIQPLRVVDYQAVRLRRHTAAKKMHDVLLDTPRDNTTNIAWAEDRATQRCDPSAAPSAKTGVRAELRRSVPLLSCPLRDWPQSDKPSRHDAATRRTGGPHTAVGPEADLRSRHAIMGCQVVATPRNVFQNRANPAIDRARSGIAGSAKLVSFLTAADTTAAACA